ncbi:excalibur calcium-binding domain-containing protein [Nonomuraea sp. NPDC050328]|uniref:excalibur calcium-binding domain-containing protein n=1 Tax=Nonomuraea sp. NPDC050328 TaxID=3364361 RepID=UPI0037A7D016
MKLRRSLGALCAAALVPLAFVAGPAVAAGAGEAANARVILRLVQLPGPVKAGKLTITYAKGSRAAVADRKSHVKVRGGVPFRRAFTLKPGTCAAMAVPAGVKGVRFRLDLHVDGKLVASVKGLRPVKAYCHPGTAPAADPAPTPTPTPTPTPDGNDPKFGTCGEANDNGYGPYVKGVDPEYEWYDDRDDDGIVCER